MRVKWCLKHLKEENADKLYDLWDWQLKSCQGHILTLSDKWLDKEDANQNYLRKYLKIHGTTGVKT